MGNLAAVLLFKMCILVITDRFQFQGSLYKSEHCASLCAASSSRRRLSGIRTCGDTAFAKACVYVGLLGSRSSFASACRGSLELYTVSVEALGVHSFAID